MVLLAFTCPGQLEHWGYVFSFPSGRTVTLFRERSTSLRIPPPILIISTDCSHTRRATTPRSRWPLPALGSVPAASETLGLRAFLPEGKHFQEPPSGARVPPPPRHGRSRIVPAPPRPAPPMAPCEGSGRGGACALRAPRPALRRLPAGSGGKGGSCGSAAGRGRTRRRRKRKLQPGRSCGLAASRGLPSRVPPALRAAVSHRPRGPRAEPVCAVSRCCCFISDT